MNTKVNFEIAKLLKDKRFDEPCNYYYELEYTHLYPKNTIHIWDPMFKTKFKNSYQWEKAAAPTIANVCMWLYEKHSIWIYIKQGYKWEWYIETVANHPELKYNDGLEDSPTEAYEEAIIYTLENLI